MQELTINLLDEYKRYLPWAVTYFDNMFMERPDSRSWKMAIILAKKNDNATLNYILREETQFLDKCNLTFSDENSYIVFYVKWVK